MLGIVPPLGDGSLEHSGEHAQALFASKGASRSSTSSIER